MRTIVYIIHPHTHTHTIILIIAQLIFYEITTIDALAYTIHLNIISIDWPNTDYTENMASSNVSEAISSEKSKYRTDLNCVFFCFVQKVLSRSIDASRSRSIHVLKA